MDVKILDNGVLRIDGARIVYRNFAGEISTFNPKGDRTFSVVIPNDTIRELLENDVNEYGVGWKISVKPPKEEGEDPFVVLKNVKVAFKDEGSGNPHIYVQSGSNRRKLTAETVGMLDRIRIESVDMDIRPFDGVFQATGVPFRAAYVNSMLVHQLIEDRFADEEYPEE